jgi:hypothetical protein
MPMKIPKTGEQPKVPGRTRAKGETREEEPLERDTEVGRPAKGSAGLYEVFGPANTHRRLRLF